MNDLPDNVLGISAEGEVTGPDYETVLIPAINNKLKTNSKIRLLYHLGSRFDGFTITAMIDDAKIGMKNLAAWDKIALVSNHQRINVFAKSLGYLLDCRIQTFKENDLQKAKQWIIDK